MKIGETNITVKKLISNNTADGIIFSSNNRKVIKVIPLTTNEINLFKKEVEIGKKINKKYGAKVIASQITNKGSKLHTELIKQMIPLLRFDNKTKSYWVEHYAKKLGLIVMENLKQTDDELPLRLVDYLRYFRRYKQACPGKRHKIYKMLRETLLNFYKLGYYHGDLHYENIHVILEGLENYKKEKSLIKFQSMLDKIKYVKIIDFGRCQKIKQLPKSGCLSDILKQIYREFKKNKDLNNTDNYLQRSVCKLNKYGKTVRNNMSMLKSENEELYKEFNEENKRNINFKYNYLINHPASYHKKK